MKRIIPLILILLLLFCACGKEEAEQTIPSTADPNETVLQTEASATDGPEGILEEKDTETVYLMTRMSVLDDSGKESWYREYEYNDLGQMAEEFEYASTGALSYRAVYTYNEAGLCTAREVSLMDSDDASKLAGTQTIKYSYNEKDQLVLQQSYENDALFSYDEFTYDEQGNFLTYKMYFGGELAYDWSYNCSYDGQGNLLTREEYLDGELAYRVECTYDEAGRCTGTTTYSFDGSVENRTVITWENTTETKCYYDMTDTLYLTTVTTYDEHGNITLQESQYYGGTVTMTEYDYEPFEIKK